jgi:hypothetical protein
VQRWQPAWQHGNGSGDMATMDAAQRVVTGMGRRRCFCMAAAAAAKCGSVGGDNNAASLASLRQRSVIGGSTTVGSAVAARRWRRHKQSTIN